MGQLGASITKRRISICVILFVLLCGINFALDYGLCIFSPCISKSRAFGAIHVGAESRYARELLFRAGVVCPGEEMLKCSTLMFSDFWRDYSVTFDPVQNIVIEKKFSFKNHGGGMLERLHILRIVTQ
jgi:hypothetical protein